jgi:hypothetical protein
VVFAGGRFQSTQTPLFVSLPARARRIEFGVRIAFPNSHPLLGDPTLEGVVDPKCIWRLRDSYSMTEYRTFCFCRAGQTTLSSDGRFRVYSGRADLAPTCESNFGFLVRLVDLDEAFIFDMLKTLENVAPFECAWSAREDAWKRFGRTFGDLLRAGVELLLERFPSLRLHPAGVVVRGPCIEGVGLYPDVDPVSLRVRDDYRSGCSTYAIGDASGLFRGIVPSMLSGAWLAQRLQPRIVLICGYKRTGKDTLFAVHRDRIRAHWAIYARAPDWPCVVDALFDSPHVHRVAFADALKEHVKCTLVAANVFDPAADKDTTLAAYGGRSLRDLWIDEWRTSTPTQRRAWERDALGSTRLTGPQCLVATDFRFHSQLEHARAVCDHVAPLRVFRREVPVPDAAEPTEHDLDTLATSFLLVPISHAEEQFRAACALLPQYAGYVRL